MSPTHLPVSDTVAEGKPGHGVAVNLVNLCRSYGPIHALDGLTLDIAPESSWHSWAPPAAARPRPYACWPGLRMQTPDASRSGARTSRPSRPAHVTWGG